MSETTTHFAVRIVLEEIASDLTRTTLLGRDCALFTLPLPKGDAVAAVVPRMAQAAGQLAEEIKDLVDQHSSSPEAGQEAAE